MFLWDYVITFDLEVRNVWNMPPSAPGVLFLINRYSFLVSDVLALLSLFWVMASNELLVFMPQYFYSAV